MSREERAAPKENEARMNEFIAKLEDQWNLDNFVCVGLDTEFGRLPDVLRQYTSKSDAVVHFNKDIVDVTHDLVCAYKPNAAFYEALGSEGWDALFNTIDYIKTTYPDIPVILDAKRGDIGSTNEAYATAVFDELKADAVTVHPYFGQEALRPLLDRKNKGIIVMASNSNPGAGEFQDLPIGDEGEPLYKVVARQVATSWNNNGNCVATVGATFPEKISQVRSVVGDMPLLVLGVGQQGGEVEPTIQTAKHSRGWGMIVNSTRAIIYASDGDDYKKASRAETMKLRTEINRFR
jgi:orotidine-5'-phosphate decarboxylase